MRSESRGQDLRKQNKLLQGRTFLVTRTREGNIEERHLLEGNGAKVVDFPTIKISPPSSMRKMDLAISDFEEFDWVVFTSSNGVKLFFQRLAKKRPRFYRNLKHIERPKFGCVGPSTRYALERLGFRCSAVPEAYLTEELGKLLAKKGIAGKKILLARAEVANRSIARILREAGATVTEVPVYRTVSRTANISPPKNVTDITLTSPSTAEGVLQVFKDPKFESLRVHCIGPVTAGRARELGLEVYTVAKVHTIDGLINDIVKDSSRLES